MLKRQGAIEAWHDRRISAGDDFSGSIDQELERADVILLLVSPDYLASRYCYDVEMTRAMERQGAGEARVIPVILRHCDWHSAPFGKLLAAPRDGKPIQSWPDLDEAFLDVVHKIRAALPKPAAQQSPAAPQGAESASQATQSPRSSNLRLKKSFTEVDQDRFLDEAFAYMARFFEGSLNELKERNPGIDTAFRQIDANRFTCVIYKEGQAVSRCKITLGGMFGKGITYSMNERSDDRSTNDSLSVNADDNGLFLKALGMASFNADRERHLTFEGAAEYYWTILMRPLQG